MIEANNPALKSFINIAEDNDFPIQNLPFGIFSDIKNPKFRIGVAIGEYVLDLAAMDDARLIKHGQENHLFLNDSLNPLMAIGLDKVRDIRNQISRLLRHDQPTLRDNTSLRHKALIPMTEVKLHLPAEISGYTDFFSSKQHALNCLKIIGGKDSSLPPNWVYLPTAYDGRAGSIVVSGTDVYRPCGQIKISDEHDPSYSSTQALDIEVEIGCFIGTESNYGEAVSMSQAPGHLFGMTLLNDWSARDIQMWESRPLGPFLGKNFCTSISPWVVTMDALEPFRVKSPQQTPEPMDYLQRVEDWAIDIQLELALQTATMDAPQTIARMNYKDQYWDICQQVAHHTVNGCPMKLGDLLASGTISGEASDTFGSLLELSNGGKRTISLKDGAERTFLQDSDTAIIRGFCQGEGYRIGFGEVHGTVLPTKVK